MKITERQKTILELMCKDYNQKNIAYNFRCSLSLVEKEIKTLKELYKVETNSGLIFNHLKRNLKQSFINDFLI